MLLSDWNFADKTSAIGIHPGPDFDQVQYRLTVSFFEHPKGGGRELVLGPGTYSNIHKIKIQNLGTVDFGDIISAVRFNHVDVEPDVEPDGPAATHIRAAGSRPIVRWKIHQTTPSC